MNHFRLVTAAALVALNLVACQPSDQKVKSVRERLEAGETVEFTKPGMKTPNCGPAEWTTIKVANKQERDRVIVGSQYSIVNNGFKFCGRIGRPVDMTVFKDDKNLGQVVVKKISLVKLDKLRSAQLKGKFFANEDDLTNYKSTIKLFPDNLGIITIIDTQYSEGSAKDEKAVREREGERNNTDGFEETTQDGQDISKCPTPWSDIGVADDFQSAVMSGELGSWYSLGDKNCIRQGSTVNIKSKVGKDEPVKGQIKVVKIKRLRMNFLEARYFDMRGFDFEKLKTQISKDNFKRSEWITVVDFAKKQDPEKPGEVKQVTVGSAEINGDGAIATVQGLVDFTIGEIIVVNVINENKAIEKRAATVIGSLKMTDTTLVKIKFTDHGGPK